MKTPEELNAIKEEAEAPHKKPSELSDEELGQIAGGGWWDDFVDWLEGKPRAIEVSYNPPSGKYFCPNCGDGNHHLAYYGYEYRDGGNYDKYKCEHCGKWYWHFISGERCGEWIYAPYEGN